jgi:hypothetical protein
MESSAFDLAVACRAKQERPALVATGQRTTDPATRRGASGSELSPLGRPAECGYAQTLEHGHLAELPEPRADLF